MPTEACLYLAWKFIPSRWSSFLKLSRLKPCRWQVVECEYLSWYRMETINLLLSENGWILKSQKPTFMDIQLEHASPPLVALSPVDLEWSWDSPKVWNDLHRTLRLLQWLQALGCRFLEPPEMSLESASDISAVNGRETPTNNALLVSNSRKSG